MPLPVSTSTPVDAAAMSDTNQPQSTEQVQQRVADLQIYWDYKAPYSQGIGDILFLLTQLHEAQTRNDRLVTLVRDMLAITKPERPYEWDIKDRAAQELEGTE